MADETIHAPWTQEQVAKLNAFQNLGYVHEYTCPVDHPGINVSVLWATTAGWVCPACSYTQDWARASSLEPGPNPLDALDAAFEENAKRQRAAQPLRFDHAFEPGAYGVCRRCGGNKH